MIPIRDLTPSRARPWVTWSLIGLNVAVFAFQWALGSDGEELLIRAYGLVPAALFSGATPGSWVTLFTHMFLHGGLLHVAANMWFLHIFGDNVEEALGAWRYLVFYLVCGLAAAALQVAIDPSATVPMVGASGAIAGVLGASLLLFPHGRVLTLVPVMFFIELPSFVFIVLWFGLQLAEVLLHLRHEATSQGGVAFAAHIGGLLIALALAVTLVAHADPPTLATRARTGAVASRLIHFTFDDGPDPAHTPALLDALDAAHVRATFFLLGDRLARPGALEVAREIRRRGHEIGAHSFHHVALGHLDAAGVASELDATDAAFAPLGDRPTLFRPPYGNTTARVDWVIEAHGYRVALWALNSADYAAPDAAAAVHTFERILDRQARQGVHGGIVLMHDTHPFSVEEFNGVMAVLRRRSCAAIARGEEPYAIASDARALLDEAAATTTPVVTRDDCTHPHGG